MKHFVLGDIFRGMRFLNYKFKFNSYRASQMIYFILDGFCFLSCVHFF